MADKNVPSEEVKLKEVESKDRKKDKKESWSVKKIITTVIIAILALLMIGSAYYIILIIQQDKAEDASAFGYYDGEPIRIEQNNVFYNTLMSDEDFMNAYLSGDYSTLMSCYYEAYQQQVLFTALSKQAEEAGITSPETLVEDLILKSGVYSDDEGNFDQEAFEAATESEKLQVMTYYSNLYPYQRVVGDLSSVLISQPEVDFIVELSDKTRSFEYFTIDYNAYPDDLAIEYAKKDESKFYEIGLSVISTSTEENAKAVAQALADGTSWDEVCSTYSEDSYAEDNGYIGEDVAIYSLLSVLSDESDIDAILALDEGKTTEPVALSYGYGVFRIEKKAVAPDYSDASTISGIKYYLSQNEADTVTPYIEEAKAKAEELAKADFSAAAEICNAEIVEVSSVVDNVGESQYMSGFSYYDSVGALNTAAEDNEELNRELFTADVDYVTGAITVEDGTYLIVKVTNVDAGSSYMSSLVSTFYAYYAQTQATYDAFYAVFDSDKLEDNFYTQFFSTILGSTT